MLFLDVSFALPLGVAPVAFCLVHDVDHGGVAVFCTTAYDPGKVDLVTRLSIARKKLTRLPVLYVCTP